MTMISISTYSEADQNDVLNTLKQDRNWDILTNDDTIQKYKNALKSGITYVARQNAVFCGFIRAISDEGIALYISELYVKEEYRNSGIGHALIERIRHDFQAVTVYALSDEDAYYAKHGYRRIGSVFEM